MKTFWGHRGPKSGTCEGPKMHMYGQMRAYWSNSMHSSVFHPFPMKQANWLVMAPKGLFMAKWGPLGPTGAPIEGPLGSNYYPMGHLTCIQVWLFHISLNTSQLAPKLTFRAKWGPFELSYQTWKWRFLKIGSVKLLVISYNYKYLSSIFYYGANYKIRSFVHRKWPIRPRVGQFWLLWHFWPMAYGKTNVTIIGIQWKSIETNSPVLFKKLQLFEVQ